MNPLLGSYFEERNIKLKDLADINGVTIEEIEIRSIPLLDRLEDPKHAASRSSFGFLYPQESFKSRLFLDATLVSTLHLSHQYIANQLKRLIQETEQERRRIKAGKDSIILIDFQLSPNSISSQLNPISPQLNPIHFQLNPISSQFNPNSIQKIQVNHTTYMSSQSSFFKNFDHHSLDGIVIEDDQQSWHEDYIIRNLSFPNIELTIAGNTDSGSIYLIEKYGFYQSGEANPYRIDPQILLWILTGHPTRESIDKWHQYIKENEIIIMKEYLKMACPLKSINCQYKDKFLKLFQSNSIHFDEKEIDLDLDYHHKLIQYDLFDINKITRDRIQAWKRKKIKID